MVTHTSETVPLFLLIRIRCFAWSSCNKLDQNLYSLKDDNLIPYLRYSHLFDLFISALFIHPFLLHFVLNVNVELPSNRRLEVTSMVIELETISSHHHSSIEQSQ